MNGDGLPGRQQHSAGRGIQARCRQRAEWMSWAIAVFALIASGGCSYLGTVVSQVDYSLTQAFAPQQRIYKHLLDQDTFFVFGQIEAREVGAGPMAVVAISDRYQHSEVVDVSNLARPDSYYGLHLPPGEFELLAVRDLDGDGRFGPGEVFGSRRIVLADGAVPDRVAEGRDIALAAEPVAGSWQFAIPVAPQSAREESVIFPKGTLRSLDDPIFSESMASLGMYSPAAFLEAAPMMFYALEEESAYKVPVVFVHGIGGSARDFESIVARLDRRRFKPWFFHYPSGTDLGQSATMFYKLFLSGRVIPLGDMPLVIVAHSMGGLVVREAFNRRQENSGENRVARLITIASPLGGVPGARHAEGAPVVVPSWRNLSPDSDYVSGLYRRPLPDSLEYHLLFAYGDERSVRFGANSDGVIPLSSQLAGGAQHEATAQAGFDATHTGVLDDGLAIREIIRIVSEVRAPFPDDFIAMLMRGGFQVPLDARYSARERHYIRSIGVFMDAMASGRLQPIHPAQQQFVRVARGEAAPGSDVETAWLKFVADYPDRSALPIGQP